MPITFLLQSGVIENMNVLTPTSNRTQTMRFVCSKAVLVSVMVLRSLDLDNYLPQWETADQPLAVIRARYSFAVLAGAGSLSGCDRPNCWATCRAACVGMGEASMSARNMETPSNTNESNTPREKCSSHLAGK